MIEGLSASLIDVAKSIIRESIRQVNEAVEQDEKFNNTTFFHGTAPRHNESDDDFHHKLIDIANNGLRPGADQSTKEQSMTPMRGRTYATKDIGYGQIYAMGANVAGSSYKPKHKHGYLFAFKGDKLNNVLPDEDEIGTAYRNHHHTDKKLPYGILSAIEKHGTTPQLNRTKEGEYEFFAKLGKRVIPKMSDQMHTQLVNDGFANHVSSEGNIMPERVYRIDTDKIPLLKQDGSNFFDHAEELNIEHLKQGIITPRRKRKPM